jgi:hypothetical protein
MVNANRRACFLSACRRTSDRIALFSDATPRIGNRRDNNTPFYFPTRFLFFRPQTNRILLLGPICIHRRVRIKCNGASKRAQPVQTAIFKKNQLTLGALIECALGSRGCPKILKFWGIHAGVHTDLAARMQKCRTRRGGAAFRKNRMSGDRRDALAESGHFPRSSILV